MTEKEFKKMVDLWHKEGHDDDDIMKMLYINFSNNKISLNDYEIMVSWLGYNLTDDFYQMHGIKRKK